MKSCLRADEFPEKGMKNVYSYAKLILMQKKNSHMIHVGVLYDPVTRHLS